MFRATPYPLLDALDAPSLEHVTILPGTARTDDVAALHRLIDRSQYLKSVTVRIPESVVQEMSRDAADELGKFCDSKNVVLNWDAAEL